MTIRSLKDMQKNVFDIPADSLFYHASRTSPLAAKTALPYAGKIGIVVETVFMEHGHHSTVLHLAIFDYQIEEKPLYAFAVRSSSLLEDSHYQPFAGIYSTYMVPYTADAERRLKWLSSVDVCSACAGCRGEKRKALLPSTIYLPSPTAISPVEIEFAGNILPKGTESGISGHLYWLQIRPIIDRKQLISLSIYRPWRHMSTPYTSRLPSRQNPEQTCE